MIIVMQATAQDEDVQRVVQIIRQQGLSEHISRGKECTIIGAVGDERVFDIAQIEALPQVERAIRIVQDWRIISREAWAQDTQITVRGMALGGHSGIRKIQAIAQTDASSLHLNADSDAALFDPFYTPANPCARAGCFSLENTTQTLHDISQICRQNNKIIVMRIRDSAHLEVALSVQADILYLGGELLANRSLLQEVGSLNIPTIVCKDNHHRVRDWLVAAEQIVLRGNQHVILGDAGTLSLHGEPLRLDVDALVAAKKLSHLPVLANISQLAHRHMDKQTLWALACAAQVDAIIV